MTKILTNTVRKAQMPSLEGEVTFNDQSLPLGADESAIISCLSLLYSNKRIFFIQVR